MDSFATHTRLFGVMIDYVTRIGTDERKTANK